MIRYLDSKEKALCLELTHLLHARLRHVIRYSDEKKATCLKLTFTAVYDCALLLRLFFLTRCTSRARASAADLSRTCFVGRLTYGPHGLSTCRCRRPIRPQTACQARGLQAVCCARGPPHVSSTCRHRRPIRNCRLCAVHAVCRTCRARAVAADLSERSRVQGTRKSL